VRKRSASAFTLTLTTGNSPNGCVISLNSVAFWSDYVKVVEDTPILSAAKNLVFGDISFTAILAGDHPSESVK